MSKKTNTATKSSTASQTYCIDRNAQGRPCGAPHLEGSLYCKSHDPRPEIREQVREERSRGGKARHNLIIANEAVQRLKALGASINENPVIQPKAKLVIRQDVLTEIANEIDNIRLLPISLRRGELVNEFLKTANDVFDSIDLAQMRAEYDDFEQLEGGAPWQKIP